nr:RNA 2',3'-cyclic phosphodiesterase [Sulfuricella denitrificans]
MNHQFTAIVCAPPDSISKGKRDEPSTRKSHIKPTSARLFFALWPSAAASAELVMAGQCLYGICGGRLTRMETIHLTLAFLGEVGPERIGDLLELAGEIRVPEFNIGLTRFGWWPHNRIVWAAPGETPVELVRLIDSLREKLLGAGFRFDTKSFVPHITLLRKADCRKNPLLAGAIEWRARDFVLVRSVSGESGSSYEVVGRWKLL